MAPNLKLHPPCGCVPLVVNSTQTRFVLKYVVVSAVHVRDGRLARLW